jgi:hypothetical protein
VTKCGKQEPSSRSEAYGTQCVHPVGHDGEHLDAFGELWDESEEDNT